MVPGSGIAGSIPFSPPKAYFEENLIAHAIRTSMQGAAIFSQVFDSPNGKEKPDFILDVVFGHMYVGMVFMGEGVTVDFPCTWRLLRQNDGKEVINHTVQAHGAGNSLSSKAASKKAFERALRDAIAKGISFLSQQVDVNKAES